MKFLIILSMTVMMDPGAVIVDFTAGSSHGEWRIVDDVVMGGRSGGSFSVSEEGMGVFQGRVSLENNGGFSSVQYNLPKRNVEAYRYFGIRLKGDGKRYQFRVRSDPSQSHSYAHYFQTSGEWQTIRVSMDDMFPTLRGVRLNIPGYPGRELSMIAFLIGNERNEEFCLEIESIRLAN
jgi:NADH dehydrogenase [ubiquinone] 1 alpha subcomplex assembly factor 1